MTALPHEAPPLDDATLEALAAEAETSDPDGSSMSWRNAPDEDRPRILRDAATWRANAAASVERYEASLRAAGFTEAEIREASAPWHHDGPAAASIGTRTGLDLRHGPALPPLADPFLTAEGSTVVYARGGTGKGVFACHMAGRLTAAGHVLLVVDFEGHEREWGSRLRGLGLTEAQLAAIHYRAPFGPDWTAPTGSLATIAPLLRADAERLGATYLIVDSYTVATANGDTMGGEGAAREYFTGLATIGLPSLTIAHVRGDSARFPDRPFGSVFVHNLARETWAVERLGDEPETDPDLIRVGPSVVQLELRNKKANGRERPAAQFVTFSFFADGSIDVSTDRLGRSVADLAADALADGPLTLPRLIAAIKEDTGETVSQDVLRRTLNRDARRFVHVEGTRPRPWGLR